MSNRIIGFYKRSMEAIHELDDQSNKAGAIREAKGKLVEEMTQMIILEAWRRLGGKDKRLKFNKRKYRIRADQDAIESLPEFIRQDVLGGIVHYDIGVDAHVEVDDQFVMAVECKAYTENAMLKRILVDFWLLQKSYPQLRCLLVQLETFLGGAYDEVGDERVANSSTYTLMSYFPDVGLEILTLLEGARHVHKPIHARKYRKSLKRKHVEYVIGRFQDRLTDFV